MACENRSEIRIISTEQMLVDKGKLYSIETETHHSWPLYKPWTSFSVCPCHVQRDNNIFTDNRRAEKRARNYLLRKVYLLENNIVTVPSMAERIRASQ